MAKRKHAAALFEVFHDNKLAPARPPRPTGWWFKGRSAQVVEAPVSVFDENDPTTMPIRSPLIAPRIAAVEAMTAPVVRREVPAPNVSVKPKASEPNQPSSPWFTKLATRFHLDPDSREVTFRLPFTSALIATFGIVLLIAIAYVMGRRTADSRVAELNTQLADAREAADVRPSALDLPRHTRLGATVTARPAPRAAVDDSRSRDHESTPMANSVHDIEPITSPDVAPVDGPRIIGLNYLLVQNYPNQASANETRDFLVSNGVSCTVEKVPAGFFCPDPNWMAVITTRGFDREQLHSPEYDNFKHQLEKLGDKFAGNGKFKRFSLLLYKLK